MKKEYIKPNVAALYVVAESMLALSDNRENMGSNETPGGPDDSMRVPTEASGVICGKSNIEFKTVLLPKRYKLK